MADDDDSFQESFRESSSTSVAVAQEQHVEKKSSFSFKNFSDSISSISDNSNWGKRPVTDEQWVKRPLFQPDEKHLDEPVYHTEWKVDNLALGLKTIDACADLVNESEEIYVKVEVEDAESIAEEVVDDFFRSQGMLAEVAVPNMNREGRRKERKQREALLREIEDQERKQRKKERLENRESHRAFMEELKKEAQNRRQEKLVKGSGNLNFSKAGRGVSVRSDPLIAKDEEQYFYGHQYSMNDPKAILAKKHEIVSFKPDSSGKKKAKKKSVAVSLGDYINLDSENLQEKSDIARAMRISKDSIKEERMMRSFADKERQKREEDSFAMAKEESELLAAIEESKRMAIEEEAKRQSEYEQSLMESDFLNVQPSSTGISEDITSPDSSSYPELPPSPKFEAPSNYEHEHSEPIPKSRPKIKLQSPTKSASPIRKKPRPFPGSSKSKKKENKSEIYRSHRSRGSDPRYSVESSSGRSYCGEPRPTQKSKTKVSPSFNSKDRFVQNETEFSDPRFNRDLEVENSEPSRHRTRASSSKFMPPPRPNRPRKAHRKRGSDPRNDFLPCESEQFSQPMTTTKVTKFAIPPKPVKSRRTHRAYGSYTGSDLDHISESDQFSEPIKKKTSKFAPPPKPSSRTRKLQRSAVSDTTHYANTSYVDDQYSEPINDGEFVESLLSKPSKFDNQLMKLMNFLRDFCVDVEISEKDVFQVYIDEENDPEFDDRWCDILLNKSAANLPSIEEMKTLFTNPAFEAADPEVVATFLRALKTVLDQRRIQKNRDQFESTPKQRLCAEKDEPSDPRWDREKNEVDTASEDVQIKKGSSKPAEKTASPVVQHEDEISDPRFNRDVDAENSEPPQFGPATTETPTRARMRRDRDEASDPRFDVKDVDQDTISEPMKSNFAVSQERNFNPASAAYVRSDEPVSDPRFRQRSRDREDISEPKPRGYVEVVPPKLIDQKAKLGGDGPSDPRFDLQESDRSEGMSDPVGKSYPPHRSPRRKRKNSHDQSDPRHDCEPESISEQQLSAPPNITSKEPELVAITEDSTEGVLQQSEPIVKYDPASNFEGPKSHDGGSDPRFDQSEITEMGEISAPHVEALDEVNSSESVQLASEVEPKSQPLMKQREHFGFETTDDLSDIEAAPRRSSQPANMRENYPIHPQAVLMNRKVNNNEECVSDPRFNQTDVDNADDVEISDPRTKPVGAVSYGGRSRQSECDGSDPRFDRSPDDGESDQSAPARIEAYDPGRRRREEYSEGISDPRERVRRKPSSPRASACVPRPKEYQIAFVNDKRRREDEVQSDCRFDVRGRDDSTDRYSDPRTFLQASAAEDQTAITYAKSRPSEHLKMASEPPYYPAESPDATEAVFQLDRILKKTQDELCTIIEHQENRINEFSSWIQAFDELSLKETIKRVKRDMGKMKLYFNRVKRTLEALIDESANSIVRQLEEENRALRKELETAKSQHIARCKELSDRNKRLHDYAKTEITNLKQYNKDDRAEIQRLTNDFKNTKKERNAEIDRMELEISRNRETFNDYVRLFEADDIRQNIEHCKKNISKNAAAIADKLRYEPPSVKFIENLKEVPTLSRVFGQTFHDF